jgi:modification methylase
MYSIEDIKNEIIVGDVLKELQQFPNECIDITVTSPPYNKAKNSFGWLVQNNGYSHFDDTMSETAYQDWQIDILNELHRITKPGGSLFYNHKIRWVKGKLLHPYGWIARSVWDMRQEIIWDRTLAGNVRGWRFWQVEEHIYWLYKPIDGHLVGKELESRHAKMGSIWRIDPVPRSENHPAPFPLELPIRAIFSMVGNEKKVILDPFCGTGTTLVAAKLLGHDYVGIDISPDYIEYAKKRLDDCQSEWEVAKAEIDLHVVDDPYKDRKERGTVSWPFAPDNEDNGNKSKDSN